MSALFLRPVQRAEQAQEIAVVRNSGRQFMTKDKFEISPERQAQWFSHTYLPEHAAGRLHAFVGYDGAEAVAYGLVKVDDAGEYWLTGVVAPQAQGKGYGKELFTFLTDFALYRADHVMLDVLKSNEKAHKLYLHLGYLPVSENGDVIVMRGGVQ